MANENENTYKVILGVCIRVLMDIVFVFLLAEGFRYSYHFSYKLFADLPKTAASTDVMNITIEEGSSTKDIAYLLEVDGVVEDQYIFLARAYLGKYNENMKAGTYSLGPGMTPDEICRLLCGMQGEEAT